VTFDCLIFSKNPDNFQDVDSTSESQLRSLASFRPANYASTWAYQLPVTPQRRPYPAGPTSPPQGHRPVPQLRRDRDQPPNDLQRFSGLSVEPFCRWAFMVVDGRGREQPNHNHGNDVQAAIWVSETIVSQPFLSLSLHIDHFAGYVRQRSTPHS
jgi:hypothetical protein